MPGILILRASDISFHRPRPISFRFDIVTWKLNFDAFPLFHEFPWEITAKKEWNTEMRVFVFTCTFPLRLHRRLVKTIHAIRININKFALGLKMSSNYVFFFSLSLFIHSSFGSFATFRDRIWYMRHRHNRMPIRMRQRSRVSLGCGCCACVCVWLKIVLSSELALILHTYTDGRWNERNERTSTWYLMWNMRSDCVEYEYERASCV